MTESEQAPHETLPTSRQLETTSLLTLVGLVLAGAAIGLAIAYGVAGGTPVAVLAGLMAVPVAVGLALTAWRALLVAWVAAGIGRAVLRSGGDRERFERELIGSVRGEPDAPRTALPATWVFLPVTGVTGTVAALLMWVSAATNGALAGAMILAVAVGAGWLMRRLARTGRLLPIQER